MTSRQLSEEQMREAEECFFVFSQNGQLRVSELGPALRSLGFDPSNKEIDRVAGHIGAPSINFDQFKVSKPKIFS